MTSIRFRLAATGAVGLLAAFGVTAIAAEADFVSPLGITLETPGTYKASQAFVALSQAKAHQLSVDRTGSTAERGRAADGVAKALAAYENALPGAKRDAAAMVAALKKANRLASLDADFYARPAAFLATPGEVAAVRAAGGPAAVLSNAAAIYDKDLAEIKSQLGQGRSAWRLDFSPIPAAHAGAACSFVAWGMKTFCLGYKPCYNYWTTTNYENCM
jgi:hypothetical protein